MVFGMVFAWSVRHESSFSTPGLAFYLAAGLMIAALVLAFWKARPPQSNQVRRRLQMWSVPTVKQGSSAVVCTSHAKRRRGDGSPATRRIRRSSPSAQGVHVSTRVRRAKTALARARGEGALGRVRQGDPWPRSGRVRAVGTSCRWSSLTFV